MSEWRMTDEQALAVSYEALAMFEKEGDHRSMHHRFPEAAVRLGIVVPAQDGEGRPGWCALCGDPLADDHTHPASAWEEAGRELIAKRRDAQDGEERLRALIAQAKEFADRRIDNPVDYGDLADLVAEFAALEARPREESPK